MGNGADWAVWEGVEVEGRLYGVPTLFVGNEAQPEQVKRWMLSTYSHVYINPGFWLAHGWEMIRHLLDTHVVTVCVSLEHLVDVPDDVMQRAHIMATVTLPDTRVKNTDTLRLELGEFRVACTPFHAFAETTPLHYDGDRLLEKVKDA